MTTQSQVWGRLRPPDFGPRGTIRPVCRMFGGRRQAPLKRIRGAKGSAVRLGLELPIKTQALLSDRPTDDVGFSRSILVHAGILRSLAPSDVGMVKGSGLTEVERE